ncbi:MAG: tetratricopeptide repeat protein [Deltaproteobacteria bacterium]|nr:tetratricopeptide repeat protein [Deltaproteobacteria bacterium]
MAKKKKNVEDILNRAEKLFQRGNFPLALKEFEKVKIKLNREDIDEKISVCRKEANVLIVKDLIKRGRRADHRGNLQEALRCYKQADALGHEKWMGEKVRALRAQLSGQGALTAAKAAETAGEYQKAADLYAKAGGGDGSHSLHCNRARCLVRAGNYAEAVIVYQTLETEDPDNCYHYGVALSQTGRYGQCLQVWASLDTTDETFSAQRKEIRRRHAANLFDRFEKKKAVGTIYREARQLLDTAGRDLDELQIRGLEKLKAYCRYAWIGVLWEMEDYHTITDLLAGTDTLMAPALLSLQAKAWFKRSENDSAQLTTMVMYWLTAIYSDDILSGVCRETVEPVPVRAKLIDAVEKRVHAHKDTQAGRKAAVYLETGKRLIRDLSCLAAKRKDRTDLVCTPDYAQRYGKSNAVLELIRANKTYFRNAAHYLETGGYYSAAGKCLYLINLCDYEKAASMLADLSADTLADEFAAYVMNRVHFECCVHFLETGDGRYAHYIRVVPDFFTMAPEYEKTFTDQVLAIEDWETLKPYEAALTYIHGKRPSDTVSHALSLVMTRWAIEMYNQDQLNLKALKAATHKALQFYPENEMARGTLKETLADLETDAVFKAFNRFKLNKASRIARESEYPQVRDRYFEFVEKTLADLGGGGLEPEDKSFYLKELYRWAITLGEDHPVLTELEMMVGPAPGRGME